MRGGNVRSICKTFIILLFCISIFLYGGDVESQEDLIIATPTIIQYPNGKLEISGTVTFGIEDIFDCDFYDPNNDSAFMQNLERNIADKAFRDPATNLR